MSENTDYRNNLKLTPRKITKLGPQVEVRREESPEDGALGDSSGRGGEDLSQSKQICL